MLPTLFPDSKVKAAYSLAGPQPQILAQDEKLKLIVGGLEPGQSIPQHPEAFAVYHFLEGEGVMRVDDQQFPVQAGATVITPAGSSRGIEAQTRLAFLAVRVS